MTEATITALIGAAERGEPAATDLLFQTLYSELHRLAKRQLARSGGVGLGVTSLVHEAYLDIAGREGADFPDRARFLGYAARAMRGLIVDAVRRRQAQKRGGKFEITSIEGDGPAGIDEGEIVAITDALDELATIEPELAHLVDLKYFCGFTFAEIAALRGVTERTAQRQWDKARLFLRRSLDAGPEP